jgi:hypothetical protein
MQNRSWLKWIALGLVVFFVLSLFSIPFGMGHAGGWGHGGGWEMGRAGMDGGRLAMHGFERGGWGFGPFGFLFGLVGMVFRFGMLALLLFAGLLLWQRLSGTGGSASNIVNDLSSRISAMFTPATCPKCGHTVQSNWQHCPNCGQSLAPVTNPANHAADNKDVTPPTENVNV